MKILVVSDTHGHTKNLERVLEKVGDIDLFIHCGDLEGGEDYIRALVDVPCYMVAGNNDWFSDLQRRWRFLSTTTGYGSPMETTMEHRWDLSACWKKRRREMSMW